MTNSMKTLCVDCDGTLITSDLFHEALIRLLLRKPWMLPPVLVWWMRGRQVLKSKVAQISPLQISALPFRDEVVTYAHAEKASGARNACAVATNVVAISDMEDSTH